MENRRHVRVNRKSNKNFFNSFKLSDFSLSNIDQPLLWTVVLLVIFGSFMVISTVSYNVIVSGYSINEVAKRQVIFVLIGLGGMYFFSVYDYKRIGLKTLSLSGILILLLNILVIFLGDEKLGAKRWLNIGGLSLQPSELAKFYIVILSSYLLSIKGDSGKGKLTFYDDERLSGKTMIIRYIILGAITLIFGALIIVYQSNLSTGTIITSGFLFLVFISELHFLYTLIPVTITLIIGVYAIYGTEYRRKRILSHFLGLGNEGPTQIQQSLYAIASGGLFGRGIGNSRLKANWLPMAENDFIFAIICEEWGLFGALLLLATFYFIIRRGIYIGNMAKDRYGRFLAWGITFIIAVQTIINLLVVTGIGPVTGVPLPFISQGGTSLVVNMSMIGIILNVSRYKEA